MEHQNKVLWAGWILNFYPAYSVSPVEKVIGIHTFLLTFEGVDPSNILSGIGFGRYENFNLLSTANASFTKL